jgi:hypothetical protein
MNLPPSLAQAIHALLAAEHGEAISIRERFGAGVADRDWIAALHTEGGWAVAECAGSTDVGPMIVKDAGGLSVALVRVVMVLANGGCVS